MLDLNMAGVVGRRGGTFDVEEVEWGHLGHVFTTMLRRGKEWKR